MFTAEELAAQERKKIAEGLERLKSPKGLKTCAKIYRAPWGLWQRGLRKKGCPVVVVPSEAESEEGGDALRELMLMFPGVWVKQLPLIHLGLTIGLHYMAASDRVDLWEAGVAAGREMAGRAPSGTAGTPITVAVVPPPAAGPPASRPPGAPPEMFAGPGPSDGPAN